MKSVIKLISIGILLFILVGCGESDSDTEIEELINQIENNSEEEITTDIKTEKLVSDENKEESELGTSNQESSNTEKEAEKVVGEEPQKEIKKEEGIKSETVNQDETSNTQESSKESKEQPQQQAEVIAKSNNTVTSKEKEEILNEIDKLLDDVFKGIDEIDTIENDDLVIENEN
ncbi:hypothetical protein R9X47_05705 [Wukongibacter baidiensis]|uniref:hypothetical protein n=1 Tax=Wukongibacter baidiensis TaxID=1723361 RepID=UPI003D7FFF58